MQLRSRLLAVSATALALCASAGALASAQQAQAELQSWRVPGWSFTPGVAVGAVFDNNVAIAGPDEFGKTANDTLMQVEPFGQLEYFSGRTSFSSGYRGAMRRYFELRDLDGVDHRLYATLRHRVTRRVSIFLDESFQQSPTTDALELNGLPFLRTGSRYNLIVGGVEARLTKSLDMTSRYELSHADFLDDSTPLRDGFVQGGHTSLTYRLGARASAGGEYGIKRANLNDGARDYLFQNAGGVLHYRTGEHTTFDLSGGLTYVIDRALDETRTGPYVKAALVHRAQRATIGGEYQRDYAPSFGLAGAQRSHELSGYVEMPFRRNRFYVQESAAWRRSDPFSANDVALSTIWVRSTLGYAIQRWLRLEGHHTFTSQDNRLAGGKVTRHLAGIQVVVSEPMRIR
jgi:hypothetical protein